jgi:hypothetical protein
VRPPERAAVSRVADSRRAGISLTKNADGTSFTEHDEPMRLEGTEAEQFMEEMEPR